MVNVFLSPSTPLKFWLKSVVQFGIAALSSATILPVPLKVPVQPCMFGTNVSSVTLISESMENDHVSLRPPALELPDPEPLMLTVPTQDLVEIKSLTLPCP